MFELNQLEQLLTVAECGTLSAAAERLHLSQPALSRSMQRLEAELAVPLFTRQKNKIEFNENGRLAVDYARKVLQEAEEMKARLIAHERARHTIFVSSCAPAPLWDFLPKLSALYPEMTITSEIRTLEALKEELPDESCRLFILPYALDEPGFISKEIGEEHLCFALPPAHPLADRSSLSLTDLNGETMLLRPNLGFWQDIVHKAMPDTRFLVQEDSAFNELVRFSVLPSFVTDLSLEREGAPAGRVVVPIRDDAVNIHYYCCCRQKFQPKLTKLLSRKP